MLRLLYSILLLLFYIPYSIIIFLRIFLNKEHKSKFKEKLFSKKIQRPDGFLFWFHVASLGELNSILPIVDYYLKKNGKYNKTTLGFSHSPYSDILRLFSSTQMTNAFLLVSFYSS